MLYLHHFLLHLHHFCCTYTFCYTYITFAVPKAALVSHVVCTFRLTVNKRPPAAKVHPAVYCEKRQHEICRQRIYRQIGTYRGVYRTDMITNGALSLLSHHRLNGEQIVSAGVGFDCCQSKERIKCNWCIANGQGEQLQCGNLSLLITTEKNIGKKINIFSFLIDLAYVCTFYIQLLLHLKLMNHKFLAIGWQFFQLYTGTVVNVGNLKNA